jgi:hypothetical protein
MSDIAEIYNGILREYQISLKEASCDSSIKPHEYMTESICGVIDFDKVKESVFNKSAEVPTSCDALHFDGKELYLIEFKNGKIEGDNNKVKELHRNAYDSLLLLLEKFGATALSMREKINFIVVYREDKNDCRHKINKHVAELAKGGLVRFGFGKFSPWYKSIATLDMNAFNDGFVKEKF